MTVCVVADPRGTYGVDPYGVKYQVQTHAPVKAGSVLSIYPVSGLNTPTGILYQQRDDLRWGTVCKEAIGYYLGRGSSSRATCRGCAKVLAQNEVRVKTKLLIGGVLPKQAEVSFCVSSSCILRGIAKYSPEVNLILQC
jgi:hypothetical protein